MSFGKMNTTIEVALPTIANEHTSRFIPALNGVIYKKCRNDGMFFLLTNETAEPIAALVCAEVAARKTTS